MEKRRVGRTQLKIDVIGLGGAPLGGNFADLNYVQGVEIDTPEDLQRAKIFLRETN